MKTRLTFTLLLVAVMLDAASVQCQSFTIQTETGKQTVLARADLEALPHSRVTTGAPDSPVTYDVVTLKTLLEKAGITFHKLSGKRLASCLGGSRRWVSCGDCSARDRPGIYQQADFARFLAKWETAG
jgi:hypothetical protein